MKVCAATHLKLEKRGRADVQSERIVEKWRREMSQVSVDFPGERQDPLETHQQLSFLRTELFQHGRRERERLSDLFAIQSQEFCILYFFVFRRNAINPIDDVALHVSQVIRLNIYHHKCCCSFSHAHSFLV